MKERQIKYSDFPKVEECEDIALNVLRSGKLVDTASLSKYLKISMNGAGKRLRTLERNGLCTSRITMIKDKRGRPNKTRVYYIKN